VACCKARQYKLPVPRTSAFPQAELPKPAVAALLRDLFERHDMQRTGRVSLAALRAGVENDDALRGVASVQGALTLLEGEGELGTIACEELLEAVTKQPVLGQGTEQDANMQVTSLA
jgi:hypothetical protein